jgi:hypothetical protein
MPLGGIGAFVAFNDFPNLSARSQRFATRQVDKAVTDCVAIARKLVHVKSGYLQSTIHGEAAENSRGLITGSVIADAYYAAIEENRPGHAFIAPAVAQVQDQYLNGCQDGFEQGLLHD